MRNSSSNREAGSGECQKVNRRASVGKLRIHLQPEANDSAKSRHAKVTLEIQTNARPVYLTGIVARDVRRGWVNLEVPPLENRDEPLRWLRRRRERLEEAEFYELLSGKSPAGCCDSQKP